MKNPRRSSGFINSLVLALVLSTSLWLSCGDQISAPNKSEEIQSLDPAGKVLPQAAGEHLSIQAVMAIQDRATSQLMGNPGVVGTATSMTADGRAAVMVMVLAEDVASVAGLPAQIEGAAGDGQGDRRDQSPEGSWSP
jgi:hypothetical protein